MSASSRLDDAVGRIAGRLEEAVRSHPADNAARDDLARAFDASLHPRGTGGEWSDKGGGALKSKGRGRRGGITMPKPKHTAEVGITPFTPEDEAAAFYSSPKFQRFKTDMRRVAAKNHVTLDHVEQAAGVWEGQTEPSLAITAHDGEHGVNAWAAELGKKYDQDGVLLFHPDPNGDSASYSVPLKGRANEEVLSAMQDVGIPGGRFVDGKLEIVGKGKDFHSQVDKLADNLGLSYSAQVGRMNLLERGDYDGAIKQAHAGQDEERANAVAAVRARAASQAGRGVAGGQDPGVGAGNAVKRRVEQGAVPRAARPRASA